MTTTMNAYDVVVLGGGIMGISIAAKLAKRKQAKIALLEKKQVGNNGATKVSGGFIRVFDFNITHAKLTMASLQEHQKREEIMNFRRNGHLFILDKTALNKAMPVLEEFTKHQYPFKILNNEEVKKIAKEAIQISSNEIAIWEPKAGYANPQKMAYQLKDEFLYHGGDLFENHTIENCTENKDGSTSIQTNKGVFTTKALVICLGAWNRSFLKNKNIDCENKLIELVHAKTNLSPNEERKCFHDNATGMYSKPISKNIQLVGLPQDIYNVDPTIDGTFGNDFFETNASTLKARISDYEHANIVQKISSADSFTKNTKPEIRKIKKNWTLVNGFNGAGFKMYPAISEYVCKKMI